MMLKKVQPVIVAEPKTDDYSFGYVLRHRNWQKLQPEQRADVLRAAAEYLEAEAITSC